MTYLLDSSAWIAHIAHEPGAEQVQSILAAGDDVCLSTLSIFEMAQLLKSTRAPVTLDDVLDVYRGLIKKIVPADYEIIRSAIELRNSGGTRLSTVDAIIAASAINLQATLVHRDAHFDAISSKLLKAVRLPPKTS